MTSPTQQQGTNTNLETIRTTIQGFVKNGSSLSRILTGLTVICAALSILAIFGFFADPRQVLGQPVWAKTTKFLISTALYGASMLWMLEQIRERAPRAVKMISNGVGVMLSFEMLLIIAQAFRGRAVHFNYATPIDLTIWMGVTFGIMTFSFFALGATIVMLFQKLPSPTLTWSLRLALIVTALGMLQGLLMTSPNAIQLEQLMAGKQLDFIGGHTVNAIRDGGPGVAFLGWSTDHGDLRVGHFVGLHAMQIVPLLGVFLMRRRERWLLEGHRIGLIVIGALFYLGLIGLFTWQALRDQSIIAPDATTITAFLGLAAIAIVSSLIVITHARTTRKVIA
jgi:hypothetical protein